MQHGQIELLIIGAILLLYFVISNHPCWYPCALILTRACIGAGERSVLWQSRSRAGGRECEHRQWSTPSTVVNISIAGQHVQHLSTQLQFVNSKWTPRGTICCFESPQNLLAPLQSGVVLNLVGDSVIAKRMRWVLVCLHYHCRHVTTLLQVETSRAHNLL